MFRSAQKLSAVTQNVILGSVTGLMVAFNLRLIFLKVGGVDMVWVAFILIGPVFGYLSGLERQRVEKLKREKSVLEENIDFVQKALQESNKKYRLLVEQANDAIFLTTVDGRFLLFNEATCLYSGYTRGEMKRMRVSDLHGENGRNVDEAWLDNGVYRYEDQWISKQKTKVTLEINARWIKFNNHKLILHIGRDMRHKQAATAKGDLNMHRQRIQANLMVTMAQLNEHLYDGSLKPVFDTLPVLKSLIEKHPEDTELIQGAIAPLERAKDHLAAFSKKNERDLDTTPRNWDLNDILHQELVYLDTISDSKNFRVKTAFTPELRQVYGLGRDYSIAIGAVLLALRSSMTSVSQKGLVVGTKQLEDTVLVEVLAPGQDTFIENMLYSVDPFYEEYADKSNHKTMGAELCHALFQPLNAQIDNSHQGGKGNIVRIRIPVARKSMVQLQENEAQQGGKGVIM
ncbi:PAS domain S-box protein [bacterium]|nr:PAS domain S-box protein [bacterium]